MSTPVLATRRLSKDYGPVRVVDSVNLEFHAGSIHALLGENGAGKSTVIKMLSGATHTSEGEVLVDGEPQPLGSVKAGQSLGIVALPQELTLVPTLDAAENIYLGMRRPGRRGLVDRRRLRRDAAADLARLGQEIPVDVPVRELSAVQQTMVALARALTREARVLILDEPTAALTNSEIGRLFSALQTLRDAGTAIIYVSHRLEEVFALADQVTVMRNGQVVWTRPVTDTDPDGVVAAMIGRHQERLFPDRRTAPESPLLRVEDLRGHTVDGVSLTAHSGRVLGVAGLAGAGRSELLKLIAGAERPRGGRVLLGDDDLTVASLPRRMDAGVAYVPEERRSQGLIMRHTIGENISLGSLRGDSRLGVMDRAREQRLATRQLAELQIKATSIRQSVDELSGGNQQKVVLAKYLLRKPRLLLLDEPTRGIDVGTKAEIYHLIRRLADEGVAVVVVSSEIPELLGLADEIAVLREGRLTNVVAADQATEESILHLCFRNPA
ncbi:sugar ABC transporter ATP-binding protein [Tessaracoccus massiliensis]|uniref:sugar ABC transporter ATP-binding protein n=1 Tax=Tessaracoccus massiliensis TaxID=1522311 RepID=UPI00058CBAFA|nr:sugar ABC transporter ATP-binding protein [Tessaracoccus massiliensis]